MKKTLIGLFSIAVLFSYTTVNSFNFDSFVNNVKEKANTIKSKVNTIKGKVDTDQNKQKLAQAKSSKTGSGILNSLTGSAKGCTAANAQKDPLPTSTIKNCLNENAFAKNPKFVNAFKSTHCSSEDTNYSDACNTLSWYEQGCTATEAGNPSLEDTTLNNCFTRKMLSDEDFIKSPFITTFKSTHCTPNSTAYSKQCNILQCTPEALGAKKVSATLLKKCLVKDLVLNDILGSIAKFKTVHCNSKNTADFKVNACKIIDKIQKQAATEEKAAAAKKDAAIEEAEDDGDLDDGEDDGDIDSTSDDGDLDTTSDTDDSDVKESDSSTDANNGNAVNPPPADTSNDDFDF